MASVHIGPVTFPYPLMWANKNDPVVIGSSRRTRGGNVVTLTGENPSQSHRRAKLYFAWLPWSSLETLKSMWRLGGTYSADFEGEGDTYTVRFDPDKGVVDWKHEVRGDRAVHARYAGAAHNDIYGGELNLIIETS